MDRFELFLNAAALAAGGGLVRALKSRIGIFYAVIDSLIAGLFMLAVGVILKYFNFSDESILFLSGVVGLNANYLLEWFYRISSTILIKVRKKLHDD